MEVRECCPPRRPPKQTLVDSWAEAIRGALRTNTWEEDKEIGLDRERICAAVWWQPSPLLFLLRILEQQAVIIPGSPPTPHRPLQRAWALGGRGLFLSGRCSAANVPGSRRKEYFSPDGCGRAPCYSVLSGVSSLLTLGHDLVICKSVSIHIYRYQRMYLVCGLQTGNSLLSLKERQIIFCRRQTLIDDVLIYSFVVPILVNSKKLNTYLFFWNWRYTDKQDKRNLWSWRKTGASGTNMFIGALSKQNGI